MEVIVANCHECNRQFFFRYESETHLATPTELVDKLTGEITPFHCGCQMGISEI